MNHIFRVKNWDKDGIFCRYFFGLNLFFTNSVVTDPLSDPRIEFLRYLSKSRYCAAFMGNLRIIDLGPAHRQALQSALGVDQYVDVGLYQGKFYSLAEYPVGPAWYVPCIGDVLWTYSNDGELDALYVIQTDALALFVGGVRELQAEDFPPFTNEKEWLHFLIDYYDLVVTTDSDGYYISVYARDPAFFALADQALAAAENLVTSSEWYKENSAHLVWDEQDECLEMPSKAE